MNVRDVEVKKQIKVKQGDVVKTTYPHGSVYYNLVVETPDDKFILQSLDGHSNGGQADTLEELITYHLRSSSGYTHEILSASEYDIAFVPKEIV